MGIWPTQWFFQENPARIKIPLGLLQRGVGGPETSKFNLFFVLPFHRPRWGERYSFFSCLFTSIWKLCRTRVSLSWGIEVFGNEREFKNLTTVPWNAWKLHLVFLWIRRLSKTRRARFGASCCFLTCSTIRKTSKRMQLHTISLNG